MVGSNDVEAVLNLRVGGCGGFVVLLAFDPTGYREGTRSMRRCVYRKQLDLETLVCTRGPNFPISRLESRLMCPACGNRRVTVVFERGRLRWEHKDLLHRARVQEG